jgi:succinyl-diaminopimelate desuccinylase
MPTTTQPPKPITKTLTDLLSHLVRMPTLTEDHATNRAALDWVEQQLTGLPLHIERLEHKGYPSLVATTTGVKDPKHPRLWLSAHLDVVPGPPTAFKPTIKNGRLYGRGTHDMKVGIAVFIALLQELGANLAHYDLGLMITSDEEIGGANGVRWLLNDRGYRGQAAYMPDSGANWSIEMGAKGVIWLEATATGRAAHASRPWNGLSAIDQLYRFVEHIRTHLKPEPCDDPAHAHTTLNFGTITGGSVPNQVADTATARIDIRVTPDTGLSTIRSWINEAAAATPGIRTKFLLADPPYLVRDQEPLNLIQRLTTEVTGYTPTATVAHGSSDARFFAAHHIPTITMSPLGSGFHVPEEWIDIDGLTDYYEVTRRFVHQWCRPTS